MSALRGLERGAAVLRRAGLGPLVDRVRGRALQGLGTVAVDVFGVRLSGEMQAHGHYLRELTESGREGELVRLFRDALRPGGLAVDVGAHLGLFSLIAADAGSEVVAFEPNPRTLPHLRRNLEPVAARVTVVERAVAAVEEARVFHVAAAGDTSSLVAGDDAVEQVTVRTVRGDDVLAGRQVDAMKIDVEGAELEALAGLERTIAGSPDLKLFVECNPAALGAAGASVEALHSRLTSLGLTVQTIDERAGTLRPGIDLGGERYANLYCARTAPAST